MSLLTTPGVFGVASPLDSKALAFVSSLQFVCSMLHHHLIIAYGDHV